jgi:hypothetical protein
MFQCRNFRIRNVKLLWIPIALILRMPLLVRASSQNSPVLASPSSTEQAQARLAHSLDRRSKAPSLACRLLDLRRRLSPVHRMFQKETQDARSEIWTPVRHLTRTDSERV